MGIGNLFSSGPSLERFSTLSPNQQAADSRLSKYLNSRIGQGLPRYQGQLVAGVQPLQQQAFDVAGKYMGGLGSYAPQQNQVYQKALAGGMLSPVNMNASKQFFEQQVVPQYQQRFQQMAAPALEQAYGMGSRRLGSSGMNRALADVAGQQAQYLGDVGYQYMLQEQQAQREREAANAQYSMAAMGMQSPYQQQALNQVQLGTQVGGIQRGIEQERVQAEMNEWLRTRPEYSPVINQAMQYLQMQQMGSYMRDNPGLISRVTGGINELGAGITAGTDLIGQFMSLGGDIKSLFGGSGGAASTSGMGGLVGGSRAAQGVAFI